LESRNYDEIGLLHNLIDFLAEKGKEYPVIVDGEGIRYTEQRKFEYPEHVGRITGIVEELVNVVKSMN
ncbi:MAG: hypothetical protein ABEJ65_08960, partial [bacterium]